MKHVFITGCPRSGTTMLASILGNGDSCVAAPESHFFIDFIYKYLPKKSAEAKKADLITFFNNHYRFKQWKIDASKIKNLPEKITYNNYNVIIENTIKLFAENHSKTPEKELIRVDHTPSNIKFFNIIDELFPESKFIFIIRDPRAIFASIKGLDWGPNSSLKLSQLWVEYTAAYFAIQKLHPNRICLVKYEDIVKNAIPQIKKICDFIGIEYNNSLLEEGDGFKVPEYTFSQHALVGKTLDKHRIDKWKKELQKEDIQIIESQCGAILNAFDYESFINIKYKISKKDKLIMLFNELYYYFPNKIRKKDRESKA
jgi:hypothetical protein